MPLQSVVAAVVHQLEVSGLVIAHVEHVSLDLDLGVRALCPLHENGGFGRQGQVSCGSRWFGDVSGNGDEDVVT